MPAPTLINLSQLHAADTITWSGLHTFSAGITLSASVLTLSTIGGASGAPLKFSTSTTPTSPVAGQMWFDGTDLFFRKSGSTITMSSGGSITSIVAGTGLTGGTITTTGTIALDLTYSPTWTGTHTFNNAIVFAAAQTFNAAKLTIGSQATGDVLYASSASVWARLGIGTSGQVLTVNAGVPAWQNVPVSVEVVREVPTGTINSSNVTFTLSQTPASGSEQVFENGILQESGVSADYTISGAVITFVVAPTTGSLVLVTYNVANTVLGFTNPMTTSGDTIYGGAGGVANRLGIGTTGQVLSVVGGTTSWTSLGTAAVLNTGNISGQVTTRGTIITEQTNATYTFVATDANTRIRGNRGTAQVFTIDTHANQAFSQGDTIEIMQKGAGQISIAAVGGVTLNSVGSKVNIAAQWDSVFLINEDGLNTWTLSGSLA